MTSFLNAFFGDYNWQYYLVLPIVFGGISGLITFGYVSMKRRKNNYKPWLRSRTRAFRKEKFRWYQLLWHKISTRSSYPGKLPGFKYGSVFIVSGMFAAILATNVLNSTGNVQEIVGLSIIAGINGLTYLLANSLSSGGIEESLSNEVIGELEDTITETESFEDTASEEFLDIDSELYASANQTFSYDPPVQPTSPRDTSPDGLQINKRYVNPSDQNLAISLLLSGTSEELLHDLFNAETIKVARNVSFSKGTIDDLFKEGSAIDEAIKKGGTTKPKKDPDEDSSSN